MKNQLPPSFTNGTRALMLGAFALPIVSALLLLPQQAPLASLLPGVSLVRSFLSVIAPAGFSGDDVTMHDAAAVSSSSSSATCPTLQCDTPPTLPPKCLGPSTIVNGCAVNCYTVLCMVDSSASAASSIAAKTTVTQLAVASTSLDTGKTEQAILRFDAETNVPVWISSMVFHVATDPAGKKDTLPVQHLSIACGEVSADDAVTYLPLATHFVNDSRIPRLDSFNTADGKPFILQPDHKQRCEVRATLAAAVQKKNLSFGFDTDDSALPDSFIIGNDPTTQAATDVTVSTLPDQSWTVTGTKTVAKVVSATASSRAPAASSSAPVVEHAAAPVVENTPPPAEVAVSSAADVPVSSSEEAAPESSSSSAPAIFIVSSSSEEASSASVAPVDDVQAGPAEFTQLPVAAYPLIPGADNQTIMSFDVVANEDTWISSLLLQSDPTQDGATVSAWPIEKLTAKCGLLPRSGGDPAFQAVGATFAANGANLSLKSFDWADGSHLFLRLGDHLRCQVQAKISAQTNVAEFRFGLRQDPTRGNHFVFGNNPYKGTDISFATDVLQPQIWKVNLNGVSASSSSSSH